MLLLLIHSGKVKLTFFLSFESREQGGFLLINIYFHLVVFCFTKSGNDDFQNRDLGDPADPLTTMHYYSLRATLREEFTEAVSLVQTDVATVHNILDNLGADFQKMSMTADDRHKEMSDAIARLTTLVETSVRGDAGSVQHSHAFAEHRQEVDPRQRQHDTDVQQHEEPRLRQLREEAQQRRAIGVIARPPFAAGRGRGNGRGGGGQPAAHGADFGAYNQDPYGAPPRDMYGDRARGAHGVQGQGMHGVQVPGAYVGGSMLSLLLYMMTTMMTAIYLPAVHIFSRHTIAVKKMMIWLPILSLRCLLFKVPRQ